MIDGVKVIPLRQIADDRGAVMHMLRSDAGHFVGFGEIYFSTVHPGKVKAWVRQTDTFRNYAVPHGTIRLVLFDGRSGSPTEGTVQDLLLGPEHYRLVVIPPLVWSGFMGVGEDTAIVADCTSRPHDPTGAERRPWDDAAIPYAWVHAG